jgi:hypothetical protein
VKWELHDIVLYWGDKIKEDMVGAECGPRLRGDDNYIRGLGVRGRDRLEDRRRWEDNIKMGSINLAEGGDKRLAFVKTVMTFQIS